MFCNHGAEPAQAHLEARHGCKTFGLFGLLGQFYGFDTKHWYYLDSSMIWIHLIQTCVVLLSKFNVFGDRCC